MTALVATLCALSLLVAPAPAQADPESEDRVAERAVDQEGEPGETDEEERADPETVEMEKGPARSMVLAGTILAGISIAAYGVMAAGVVIGRQAEDRLPSLTGADDLEERRRQLRLGRTGNIMAITAGVAAATLMVTGITLIVVGRRRGRPPGFALLPLRRGVGLGWSVRF